MTADLFIVGDHHSVNRRFGIWFRPDRWAFVNFLNFIDSSKPYSRSKYFHFVKRFETAARLELSQKGHQNNHGARPLKTAPRLLQMNKASQYGGMLTDAFSQNRPSQDGNAVALKSVCSRIVST
jgi:hypothetical protein